MLKQEIPEAEIGRRAVKIAKALWPGLRLIEEGSITDRDGVDAVYSLHQLRVQIKGDTTIGTTGNLYLELYEKTAGHPEQSWRHSPARVDIYVFITDGFAVWVGVDVLAEAIVNRIARQIKPTSIGFLIPLAELPLEHIRILKHDLWRQPLLV